MRDLKNSTLIIPIKIEHPDRYRNAKITLSFLNKHIETNVIIYEVSDDGISKLDFIGDLINLRINHIIEKTNGSFHRTRYLNEMLDLVSTPVVINYDIDVLLDPENMVECQNILISGEYSVIYPYELGLGQIQVQSTFDYNGFIDSEYSMDFINNSPNINLYSAECGHCIFFNTDIYKNLGGENENFISYGPEDKERLYRFHLLTNSIIWRNGHKVYHLEHYRGDDSWTSNPNYYHNWNVFNSIKNLTPNEVAEYYMNVEYIKKYSTIGKIKNVMEIGPIDDKIANIIGIANNDTVSREPKIRIAINPNDPTTLT